MTKLLWRTLFMVFGMVFGAIVGGIGAIITWIVLTLPWMFIASLFIEGDVSLPTWAQTVQDVYIGGSVVLGAVLGATLLYQHSKPKIQEPKEPQEPKQSLVKQAEALGAKVIETYE